MERLKSHKDLLLPWWTVWPEYDSKEEYLEDHAPTHEVWLTLQQIKETREFIREEADRVASVESKDQLVSIGKSIVTKYLHHMRH